MDREEKIQKISEEIQKKINQLKQLNCQMDAGIFGIGIIDMNLSNNDIDDNSDVVFRFDTSIYKK